MFSKIYFKKNPDCFGAGFKAYGSLRASKHVHFAVTSMKLRDFSMKTMAFEKALTIIGGNLRSWDQNKALKILIFVETDRHLPVDGSICRGTQN